ncbi:hypothetical protein UFOVP74_48 [uncultured Caudovirales phage]|uniref:Terminase large subunit ribonuclease H-like domain-containing protein n=1 Tax=uncultured Caudovirales phage TaxID=2100421 RepID=A0A6J5KVR0_9CAUD|nr:hypothetical protein UFOVP74_48 [uncultured Caudovirales phage]
MTEDLKERAVVTVKTKKQHLFFVRYHFYHLHKRKFNVLYHHTKICEALDRVYSGQCTRLLITVPPRYGKTETAVKHFIAHGLALNPAALFIHLSASAPLALENSEGAKDIVKSPSYQQLYPLVQIKDGSDSKAKWYTTAGGGVYAASASGQVTGFGAGKTDVAGAEDDEDLMAAIGELEQKEGFAGALVIDDPIKADDADSEIKRQRVNRRWPNTIKSRLNSKKTPVIVIMQRLHEEDMIGFLQKTEPGVWEIINLPALYEDENGELTCLDPSKHTVEDLIAMRDNADEETRVMFQRQMQQNPTPREGLLFPKDELNYFNPASVDVKGMMQHCFAYIDPANEGGDDLSMPIFCLIGDKVYIPDVVYNQDGTDINEGACAEMILDYRAKAVNVEGNSAWYLFGNQVEARINSRNHYPEYRTIKNITNKHTRILANASFIRRHFIFRSDWETYTPQYRRFMENIFQYRKKQEGADKNKHDDAPDSLVGGAVFYQSDYGHIWAPTSPPNN